MTINGWDALVIVSGMILFGFIFNLLSKMNK